MRDGIDIQISVDRDHDGNPTGRSSATVNGYPCEIRFENGSTLIAFDSDPKARGFEAARSYDIEVWYEGRPVKDGPYVDYINSIWEEKRGEFWESASRLYKETVFAKEPTDEEINEALAEASEEEVDGYIDVAEAKREIERVFASIPRYAMPDAMGLTDYLFVYDRNVLEAKRMILSALDNAAVQKNDFWFYYRDPQKPEPATLPLYPGLPTTHHVREAKANGYVIRIIDKANGGW